MKPENESLFYQRFNLLYMKERVKQRVQAVLTALGFITKVKEKTMTNDDWSQFYTNYKAQFGITLEEDNAITDEPPAAPEAVFYFESSLR